jgi:hypothetical protein
MPAALIGDGALNIPAGATTTQTGPDMTSPAARGLKVIVNVTNAGTGSITVTIQGKDKGSGSYYPILTSAAIVANGQTVLSVYPGAAVTANVSANDALPATWRVLVTANNANAITYTVGFSTLA